MNFPQNTNFVLDLVLKLKMPFALQLSLFMSHLIKMKKQGNISGSCKDF